MPMGCGNGLPNSGEQCDDGNNSAGDGCSPVCMLEGCGNGIQDPGEECDRGGYNSYPMPKPFCGQPMSYFSGGGTAGVNCEAGSVGTINGQIHFEWCGGSITQPLTGLTINKSCQIMTLDLPSASCGDENVNGAEECDDGLNNHNNRACNDQCKQTFCGDGTMQGANGKKTKGETGVGDESCEPSPALPTCDTDCAGKCGNGKKDRGEDCDNGEPGRVVGGTNGNPNAGAVPCQGRAQIGFECTPFCGNGKVDGGPGVGGLPPKGKEECDAVGGTGVDIDGNTVKCKKDCTIETCGNGQLDAKEDCDTVIINGVPVMKDKGGVTTTNCDPAICKKDVCGDGKKGFSEGCDPVNIISGDAVEAAKNKLIWLNQMCEPATCQPFRCGDKELQPIIGEECDKGNMNGKIPGGCLICCHNCGNPCI